MKYSWNKYKLPILWDVKSRLTKCEHCILWENKHTMEPVRFYCCSDSYNRYFTTVRRFHSFNNWKKKEQKSCILHTLTFLLCFSVKMQMWHNIMITRNWSAQRNTMVYSVLLPSRMRFSNLISSVPGIHHIPDKDKAINEVEWNGEL